MKSQHLRLFAWMILPPHHFNDGRQMLIRFRQAAGRNGCRGTADNVSVGGLRPSVDIYLFLTETSADRKESKPFPGFKLVTEDKFAEK